MLEPAAARSPHLEEKQGAETTRTSQQKAATFLCKQNTPPLAVKIFPLQNGFVLHKHHASGQLLIQCPRAEQKGSPGRAQQS